MARKAPYGVHLHRCRSASARTATRPSRTETHVCRMRWAETRSPRRAHRPTSAISSPSPLVRMSKGGLLQHGPSKKAQSESRRRVARGEGEDWQAGIGESRRRGNSKKGWKQSMTKAKCIPVDDKQNASVPAPVCCPSLQRSRSVERRFRSGSGPDRVEIGSRRLHYVQLNGKQTKVQKTNTSGRPTKPTGSMEPVRQGVNPFRSASHSRNPIGAVARSGRRCQPTSTRA